MFSKIGKVGTVLVYPNHIQLSLTLNQLNKSSKSITTNCACAGVDDLITVFVTEPNLEDRIITLLSEKTGLNSRAFRVLLIPEIPKNDSGKVQYPELQKLLRP